MSNLPIVPMAASDTPILTIFLFVLLINPEQSNPWDAPTRGS